MKRILVNATQPEELRVAMVDGQELYDLDIELTGDKQRKANIYKAKIVRIEPSLEAAFVDYGVPRHGFLPFREIAPGYYRSKNAATIQEAVRSGQELIVQVTQDERSNKGAALTTFPSLPGRYLVLTPNNPRSGGISRQIEGEDRENLQKIAQQLRPLEGGGVIVRTASIGRSVEELQWDLDNQARLWEAILHASEKDAPFLIYSDNDAIVRALRDNLRDDIDEVLIDRPDIYEQAVGFVERMAPQYRRRLQLYEDATPLFTHYQIESQIETVHDRVVRLPSGGTLAIDRTEALVSIDINSARATRGSDIEVTALNTNLEAAAEAARQLRLRDLGGLVVIDFIDMASSANQKKVENELRDQVRKDRARVQLGRISRFGMLELSRQRLRAALGESTHVTCPRCDGHGSVRTVRSLALSVLRLLEEEAMKANTGMVVAELPIETSAYLLNEKRDGIDEIAERCGVRVRLLPDARLQTPHYRIARVRDDDPQLDRPFDYDRFAEAPAQEAAGRGGGRQAPARQRPAAKPAIDVAEHIVAPPRPGALKRLLHTFGGWFQAAPPAPPAAAAKTPASASSAAASSAAASSSTRRRRGGRSRRRPHEAGREAGGETRRAAKQSADGNGARSGGGGDGDSSGAGEGGKRRSRGRRGGRGRRRGREGGREAAGGEQREQSRGARRSGGGSAPAPQPDDIGNRAPEAPPEPPPPQDDIGNRAAPPPAAGERPAPAEPPR